MQKGISFGVVAFFVACIVATSLAQSESDGIKMAHEAKRLFDKAKSSDDYQLAAMKYNEALNAFEKVKSDKGRFHCYYSLGTIELRLGGYSKALEHFEKALGLAQRTGDPKGEQITLYHMGMVHKYQGKNKAALECFEKALPISRKLDDRQSEAQLLYSIGSTNISLGQYRLALDYLHKSASLRKKTGDSLEDAPTLNDLGLAYRYLGEYSKALEHYNKALVLRRKSGVPGSDAAVLDNIGSIYSAMGNLPKAMETYESALASRKKIGDLRGEGVTINNIGRLHYFWGEYDKALECYEKALDIFIRTHDQREQGNTLKNKGMVYASRGEYVPALEMYEKSSVISRKIEDVRVEGINLTNIGQVYYFLGEYSKALEHLEKSLGVFRNIGDVREEGNCLVSVGQLYTAWGQHEKAIKIFQDSLGIAKRIGDKNLEGATLINIGTSYSQIGKYDEALPNFRSCLAIYKQIGIPTNSVNSQIGNLYLDKGQVAEAESFIVESEQPSSLGRLYLEKSEFAKAGASYERLLSAAEKSRNTDDLFSAYTGLGKVSEASENYVSAKEYYEKGMRLAEEIRAGLLPSERKNFFEVRINGFYRSDPAKGLTRVSMKLNQGVNSIDSSEVTRARAFSDNISQRSQAAYPGISRDVLDKEGALVSRVAALKKELAKTDRDQQPTRFENLQKEVQSAESELTRFVETLWKQYPTYACVKYPRPVSLKDSALNPNECVLMFDVSNEGVGIKLIRNKEIAETFFKKWDQKDLENDVRKFREPFEKRRFGEFDPELAENLYKKLLLRVLVDVPKGAELIIIPDGILALLPFEALVTAGKANWKEGEYGILTPENLTFLADEYPISYYQSITALTLSRNMGGKDRPGDKLLVVADPVFFMSDRRAQQGNLSGLQVAEADKENYLQLMQTIEENSLGNFSFKRLPHTGVLAKNVANIYGNNCIALTGLQANKEYFFSKIAPRINEFGSIIFATHGIMSTRVPGLMEPFLALSMTPPGTDGFLRMSEILSLKMNADVVALTACQSGLGKELSGEGVMSMGRAFQYAGAKSVLMSLWEVEEKSAVLLTEMFFKCRKDGNTKLESLKQAREHIRNSGFRHPFFWSAFILVGETR